MPNHEIGSIANLQQQNLSTLLSSNITVIKFWDDLSAGDQDMDLDQDMDDPRKDEDWKILKRKEGLYEGQRK